MIKLLVNYKIIYINNIKKRNLYFHNIASADRLTDDTIVNYPLHLGYQNIQDEVFFCGERVFMVACLLVLKRLVAFIDVYLLSGSKGKKGNFI